MGLRSLDPLYSTRLCLYNVIIVDTLRITDKALCDILNVNKGMLVFQVALSC